MAALELDGVAAVYRPLDDEELRGMSCEQNLKDPAWVIPRACQHEQAIEWVMRRSPVLPVCFGAVFSSRAALAEVLGLWRDRIAQFLDGVAGTSEWGVCGRFDPQRGGEWVLSHDAGFCEQFAQLPVSPGARYFQEKKLRAAAGARARLAAGALATTVHAELAALAREARQLRRGGAPLRSAFLVQQDAAVPFRRRVAELADPCAARGLVLDISGPWPPFNFCPAFEPAGHSSERTGIVEFVPETGMAHHSGGR